MEAKGKSSTCTQSQIIKELDAMPDTYAVRWTEFQDDMIRKYYPTKGSQIANLLGKSRNLVQKRANLLGVHIKR